MIFLLIFATKLEKSNHGNFRYFCLTIVNSRKHRSPSCDDMSNFDRLNKVKKYRLPRVFLLLSQWRRGPHVFGGAKCSGAVGLMFLGAKCIIFPTNKFFAT